MPRGLPDPSLHLWNHLKKTLPSYQPEVVNFTSFIILEDMELLDCYTNTWCVCVCLCDYLESPYNGRSALWCSEQSHCHLTIGSDPSCSTSSPVTHWDARGSRRGWSHLGPCTHVEDPSEERCLASGFRMAQLRPSWTIGKWTSRWRCVSLCNSPFK